MLAVSIPGTSKASAAGSDGLKIAVSASMSVAAAPISPSLVSPPSHPKVFRIIDKIYGEYSLTEPVLIELILSGPLQRLKLVLQHGITGLIGLTPSPAVTRYEHSVGAMLLVRQAGGSVEAQAAALLHDVAHTALSHVVDGVFHYVVHEVDKMEYLDTTTVPHIIRKHGLDAERVLDETNFPLLELEAPAICADRLDYGIRDSLSFNFLQPCEASTIARSLCTNPRNGAFCFNNIDAARKLADAYMKSDEYAWANPTHSILYQRAAETIRLAYSHAEIGKADLWKGGDAVFWQSLLTSPTRIVREAAEKVTKDLKVVHASSIDATARLSTSEYDVWVLGSNETKVRTIDPDVMNMDGSIQRLSELDDEYKRRRESYIQSKQSEQVYHIYKLAEP